MTPVVGGQPNARGHRRRWDVAGAILACAMVLAAVVAIGFQLLVVPARCDARAPHDLELQRRELTVPLPPASLVHVIEVNDCDSGGAAYVSATVKQETPDAALRPFLQRGWKQVGNRDLYGRPDEVAGVAREVDGRRMLVVASEPRGDGTIDLTTSLR